MSQEEDDELDALWHSATAAEAERPAAKTRAAILAEAAAAAAVRRREPAANAPRYWMRVVAGVAVVGVGLMLWRQTEVPLPGETPVAAPMMQERAADAEADAVLAPEVGQAAAPQGVESAVESRTDPPAESRTPPTTQVFDNAVRANAPRAQEASPPPQPELRMAEEGERQEMKVAQQQRAPAISVDRGAAMTSAAPPTAAAITGGDLLRQHFPAQNASPQPHRLWVVLDAAGNVQLSGEIASQMQLDDLAPRIRRETGREPGSWRIETLTNAQGQPVELAIMRLPR
ncbi:MAG TPA: hypothetical protein VNQ32_15630 [Steroidobacteraceae bacterium]|nr:hypothetical protein [Steroidobacteraceae bacterium]